MPYTASNRRNRSLMTLPRWGRKVLLLAIIPVPREGGGPREIESVFNLQLMTNASNLWNAKVDFSCYIYLVGHISICSCILFFFLCYIPFVGAYIYLFLYNLRFLCAVFICWCKLFFVLASFQFVYA